MSSVVHRFRREAAWRRVPLLLGCLCWLPAATLRAQEAAPPAPAPAAERPRQPVLFFELFEFTPQERTPVPPRSPRTPTVRQPGAAPRAPQAPAAVPARVTPPAPAAPPAPKPPREVVTVVHRLSGWKLLNWLATSGPPLIEIDELPTEAGAHTNIVAGFVHSDGRKVVARLPQGAAEWEWEFAGFQPPAGVQSTTEKFGESEFTLLTSDGRSIKAEFVGHDAASGLSVLEAAEPVINLRGDEGHTEDPAVGQLVHFYAPAPAAPAARPPGHTPAPRQDGVIYLSIGQADGRLTAVTRAPSGKPFQVTARADAVGPAWTGAVATTETGSLVGIVSQSSTGETRIVSGEMVRQAVERVQARRASVPQPWLGVRGDAAFRAPMEAWTAAGWKPETALPLIRNRQGVLLTSVPPGTPAAAAGLRPGDVIARVGGQDVRTSEDLSLMLKELNADTTVNFTVWRSFEPQPLQLPVVLRGTQNPALSTAEAEARAARESLLSARARIRDVRLEEQRLRASGGAARESALAGLSESLRRAEQQLEEVMTRVTEAESRIAEARFGLLEGGMTLGPIELAAAEAVRPLQTYGVHAVGLTRRGAARLGARGGVLVVTVRPGSPAAASGLRAGDVIETVNAQPLTRLTFRRLVRQPSADPLTLGVVRDKRRHNVRFALADAPTPRP
jgi:S1-C subfamily serine protease